jgi:NADH dehydrogenase
MYQDNIDINKQLPKTWRPRVVVVGGGFAGLNFIKSLKNENVDIILIDKNNYHVFRPLIYQVATAGLEPGAISDSLRGLFHHQKNIHVRKTEAIKVMPDRYKLVTSAGVLDYDYLVLANGSKGNFYNNENIKQHAYTVNNLNESLKVRKRFIENFEDALLGENSKIPKLMNVIIIGGGATGVELAGALAELRNNVLAKDYPDFKTNKLAIYLIEAKKSILPNMSKKTARKAKRYLRSLGITVLNNTSLKACDDETVWLDNGKEIKTNLLIWAAGLKGNVLEGFNESQLNRGRLMVNEFNVVKDTKNIFAIGDLAFQKDKNHPEGLPMLAPVAIQQSQHLAENFKRILTGKKSTPFTYKDKGVMTTVGRNKAVVELPGKIRFGGIVGWLMWVFVHLFSIIGMRRKLVVFAHWIWSYFSFDKGNRLVLPRYNDK